MNILTAIDEVSSETYDILTNIEDKFFLNKNYAFHTSKHKHISDYLTEIKQNQLLHIKLLKNAKLLVEYSKRIENVLEVSANKLDASISQTQYSIEFLEDSFCDVDSHSYFIHEYSEHDDEEDEDDLDI